jgi:hypothetical protein
MKDRDGFFKNRADLIIKATNNRPGVSFDRLGIEKKYYKKKFFYNLFLGSN